MKIKSGIKIICAKETCGYEYFVPFAARKTTQDAIIDFAICPKCKTPRNPHLIEKWGKENLCKHCGIPRTFISSDYPARGLCWCCYRQDNGKIRKMYPVVV